MGFEFATATRIVFGAGSLRELMPAVAACGRRALLVGGRMVERLQPQAAVEWVRFRSHGEPGVDLVRRGAALARDEQVSAVVSVGGGSAIDAGKAIAALATQPGDVLDYLEVVGRGAPLAAAPLPFIALPTTAGTGSEVTRNAVLSAPEQRVKASLRSAWMLPRLAIIDPELSLGLSPDVTAASGLDALTQLIEPFTSVRANPLVDLYAREGIRQASQFLRRAWHDGSDLEARTAMCWASLLGGLSLANAGLGAVHGFAAPIGGLYDAPHGAVCAALLPHVTRANIDALRQRAPASSALERYAEVAVLLTGRASATAEDAVPALFTLVRELAVPGLAHHGVKESDIPALCDKAAQASSMKGNPIALSGDELRAILGAALLSD